MLARIQRSYRSSTGASIRTAVVSIVPQVDVTGYSGDTVIDRRFAPVLAFALDRTALVPSAASAGASGVRATTRRRPPGRDTRPASRLRGVGLDVTEARSAALLGIGTSLIALLIGGLLLLLRRGSSERERIAARFGDRIVSARETPPDGRWVTELTSIEELMRVAETYDRVVIRIEVNGADTYLVDDGVALYRYSPAEAAMAVASPSLAVDRG